MMFTTKHVIATAGIVTLLILFGIWLLPTPHSPYDVVTPPDVSTPINFIECIDAGNVVMESYPRQCRLSGGTTFTENIGNELEKLDDIRIDTPRPNAFITNPLTISGQARGTWFFEGGFPIVLIDRQGEAIAEGFAAATGEWMTEDFVSYSATFEFSVSESESLGTLILRKDNPSGLPEHDDSLNIPVRFR